jgi:hypothetical protein
MKTFKLLNNRTLKIEVDTDCGSPREDDNLTQMIFVGKHSHLGDKHDVNFTGSYGSRQEFIESGADEVKKQLKDVVAIKPVHLYEHGNVSISTGDGYPYNCPWDSGTCGFVVITKERIREMFGCKRVSKKDIEKAISQMDGEVETLSQWISGDVYGFVIEDEDGEHEDSCWGFYGDDVNTNGMLDNISVEDRRTLESQI